MNLQGGSHELAEHLKAAQRIAGVGSWEWDIRTNVLLWSDELYRILGVPDDFSVSFESYLSLIHPEDRPRVEAMLREGCTTGGSFEFDHRILRPDGVERLISSRAEVVIGPTSAPEQMLGTAQDVTSRTRSEEKFRGLLETAPDAMVVVDAGGVTSLVGKNGVAQFDPSMHAAVSRRLEMRSRLRHALDEDEFSVHFQPVFSLERCEVVGMEALARWDRPGDGLIPPNEFIPFAEDSGLIIPLGRFVLEQAIEQISAIHKAFPALAHVFMSVNLSVRQLHDPDLISTIETLMRESRLPRGALVLEITETVLMDDIEKVVAALDRLRATGIRIAIDDFGTGYSSLSYLQRFPVDILKIDKAFIDRAGGGPEESALAHAITRLGRTLNLETIAEGIERKEQLDALRSWGCSLGQGYLLAPPLDVPALHLFLEDQLLVVGPEDPELEMAQR